jgi:hypothetical protein
MISLEAQIATAEIQSCRRALRVVGAGALNPAFGSLTKRELELLILESYIAIGFVSESPGVYELMQKLRITRGRARSLVYDRDIRRLSEAELNALTVDALKRPLLQSQGHTVVLDIENPLLCDHIRELLRMLGHATDGSFSPTIIRLNDEAAGALVEHFVVSSDRKPVLAEFHKAGVKDKSIKGALVSMLRKGAGKIAGETGDALAKDFGELVAGVLERNFQEIGEAASRYLQQVANPSPSVAV